MAAVKRVFTVNGNHFFPLGVQSDNQSGYNDRESETAFKAVKLLHGNTLIVPVYWEQVEPEEGKFDFTAVNNLIVSAHRYEVKLILLWFATWKNGNMDYAPMWVKSNPQRFKRVMSSTGNPMWVLSSHCQANLQADIKAFTALCKHLMNKDIDRTVISIQVENEPGIYSSDRDYGTEAQAAYDSPVPAGLVTAMKKAGKGRVYDLWQEAGGKASGGTWPQMFGWEASELMTAWSIASYIDRVAEAGKAVYNISMYINCALAEHSQWMIPGGTFPGYYSSGAPVIKVLDIYKWCTPHVDLIAPDIYLPEPSAYQAICEAYSRNDNPFFLPESASSGSHIWNTFRAIADYNLTGYFFFGGESIVTTDGSLRPGSQMIADSYRCIADAIPLLLKYQGTGKIHAVVQEEYMDLQHLEFDGYLGWVQFGGGAPPFVLKDWRHVNDMGFPSGFKFNDSRGRGLVIQASKNEFYIVGVNFRLFIRHKLDPKKMPASGKGGYSRDPEAQYLTVDEGHFDGNGEFVVDHHRNGDALGMGAWVEADNGVVRVLTCD